MYDVEARVLELWDKEAIRECMARYCRGIDRCDMEALRSVYWPEATDRHGAYSGSAEGFIAYAEKKLPASPRYLHMVCNMSITLDGNRAAVESYFLALQRDKDAEGNQPETFLAGRYLDLFEKRDDDWRVLERTVVYDWQHDLGLWTKTENDWFGPRKPNGTLKPDDPVYELLAKVGRGTGSA